MWTDFSKRPYSCRKMHFFFFSFQNLSPRYLIEPSFNCKAYILTVGSEQDRIFEAFLLLCVGARPRGHRRALDSTSQHFLSRRTVRTRKLSCSQQLCEEIEKIYIFPFFSFFLSRNDEGEFHTLFRRLRKDAVKPNMYNITEWRSKNLTNRSLIVIALTTNRTVVIVIRPEIENSCDIGYSRKDPKSRGQLEADRGSSILTH